MTTVLVIDDDPDVLVLVRQILEAAGHAVVTSEDPARAPALAAEHRADAVVLDIQMPGASGFDVLRELRDGARTGGVSILFLSGLSSSEARIRGLKEGADDFLTKPFAPEELQLRLERLIARRLEPVTRPIDLSAADLERSVSEHRVVGQVYLGRYQALEVVGEGAMGLVFRGYDPLLKRPVALKTLRFGSVLTDRERRSMISQLLEEAVTVARFIHPNIVMVYDLGETPELAFIAMEYVDGTSLADYLDERRALAAGEAATLLTGIARGLAAAHGHQVVHRDVKPGNVLLGVDGSVKVTDFGVAHLVSTLASEEGKLFGTPGYLAPEALLQEGYSEASDLFSLGVIAYQCLTGDRPFDGTTLHQRMMSTVTGEVVPPRELVPEIPRAMEELVLEMLEKDPRARPAGAAEVAARLENLATGEPPWQADVRGVRRVIGERTSSPHSLLMPQL